MRSKDGQKINKPEILTPLQKKVLESLFSDSWFRRHFYLTGGTALAAFYFYHRYSEDLDFFSHGVDLTSVPKLMQAAGKKMGVGVRTVQASPGFKRFQIGEGLQVDVVADVDFRVGAPDLVGSFMVDSVKNIAVNKVCAILGRLDAKDYVDLYTILRHETFDIFELLSLGQKKDAGLDPFIWASLLADVRKLTILPRMVRPIETKNLQGFFLDLRDKVLDHLHPGRR